MCNCRDHQAAGCTDAHKPGPNNPITSVQNVLLIKVTSHKPDYTRRCNLQLNFPGHGFLIKLITPTLRGSAPHMHTRAGLSYGERTFRKAFVMMPVNAWKSNSEVLQFASVKTCEITTVKK